MMAFRMRVSAGRSELGRAGQHAVYRDAGPGQSFGKSPRDRDLLRLGHPVMDHFRRDLRCALAGDEDDRPQFARLITGK